MVCGETWTFGIGYFFLILSCLVTFMGGVIRAWITGWAPVTNMFETVVLLGFFVSCFSIIFVAAPIIVPPAGNAWRLTSIWPWSGTKSDADWSFRRNLAIFLMVPHLVLMILTVFVLVYFCYREISTDGNVWQAFAESFIRQGMLDRVAVIAVLVLLSWLIPRLILTIVVLLIFPFRIFKGIESEKLEKPVEKEGIRTNPMVQRKIWAIIGASAALAIGLLAYYNTTEFNPNIRPLVAVLRSNFWLMIHVFAIIISYALGTIAWGVSLVMLSAYLFGRYTVCQDDAGRKKLEEPEICNRLSPMLLTLIHGVVLFLTLGTILGARWADFSWGRFWSWDPKEVWALVTLLIYLVVLHARKAGWYRQFGLAVGTMLGAFAIIMTWYGLSFIFGGGGRHAYVSGESGKTMILYGLLLANLIWTLLATCRYMFVRFRLH